MSISLYSGTPGSYKSYHATADIIQWLGRGKNVISNFPVNPHKYYKPNKKLGTFIFKPNSDLNVNFLLNFAKLNHKNSIKAQTLVVIDEASILFNSRQFDRKDRMEWVNFFANHRHFNYEFILIAQQDRMLDRQIRGLLEYDYKHRALKNWNLAMALISSFCHGIFHVVEYWYPCKIKTSTQLKRFNTKIASCYDTMALFNFSDNKNKDTTVINKDLSIDELSFSDLKTNFFNKSKIKESFKYDSKSSKSDEKSCK